ncbi:MAG: hypothetical protein NT004_07755 [Bacteroidetes bacterium]|nr:hypothetical protein [Bacteroidota bacterium]
MKVEFKEDQKFTQWWLWLILIIIGLLPVYGIYKQLILGEKFGDKPMPDFGLIIMAIFIFALLALFYLMRLKTEIDQHEIRMSFFPFTNKKTRWRDIKSAKIVNYGFVGGWGIRIGTKYGTVYNTKGKMGLAIELKNGRKFCIGTQKAEQLEQILKKQFNLNNS